MTTCSDRRWPVSNVAPGKNKPEIMPNRTHTTAPLRLLARVRDVMVGPENPEERLRNITDIIAADMVAEVCSVYIKRAGDLLELFATHGLKLDAVHQTRLRVGEGLVGHIAAHARPLSLADAQEHPDFVYRPETGEEIYHSLMGVPIIRGGRVVGVMVVQNKSRRQYSLEELDVLQTVAMVLSELIGSGELVSREELAPSDGNAILPLRVEGVALNAGIGIGTAILHEPQYRVERLVAENTDFEQNRLKAAVAEMHGALDDMLESSKIEKDSEHREILETYRMIAEDQGWLTKISDAISGGLTAEAAVQRVRNDLRVRMNQVSDPYLKERIHDLDDLASRLLGHLIGVQEALSDGEMPDHVILVARNMGPAQLMDYDTSRLRGVILEEGSPASHVAIVARALDIPVVGQVKGLMDQLEMGETVIVDGDNAQVFIRPSDDVQRLYIHSARAGAQKKASYAALRDVPCITLDGRPVDLMINAGLLLDMNHLGESGAAGVGLYRTELPFMVRSAFPDVESQRALYQKILAQADGKPVVFRTLDVGGDKVLPYWTPRSEENPAMGWRAIRISLDRPSMLRQQLRALITAAAGQELQVMFPMVAEVSEFIEARRLLNRELDRVRDKGQSIPNVVKVGVMLEVPSLFFQLPQLLRHVDFISIGSNDLMQFLFASDRGNARIAGRYDFLSPAVLTFMRDVAAQCRKAGVSLSLCGEMASKPLEAMTLIGCGFRTLSMAPPAIGSVKTMVLSLDSQPLSLLVDKLCHSEAHSVREHLREYARDHGVSI